MSHLAILGASGHGKVIADTASLNSHWQKISFFDDAWPNTPQDMPWSVLGNTEKLLENLDQFSGVIVGIGNNKIRQQKHKLLEQHSATLATIIHPKASVSHQSHIGSGSVVFAQAAINIHAKIGLSSIVNTGATIDHDCHLSDFTHVSPGAHLGGNVTVGNCSWIGIGSSIRQGITIGNDVTVGAGSTVVNNITDKQTIIGSPAKPLSKI